MITIDDILCVITFIEGLPFEKMKSLRILTKRNYKICLYGFLIKLFQLFIKIRIKYIEMYTQLKIRKR